MTWYHARDRKTGIVHGLNAEPNEDGFVLVRPGVLHELLTAAGWTAGEWEDIVRVIADEG